MKIKRYVVQNMKEAVGLIKQDLGPEAIVISSQRVKEKGLRGLFSPGKIEVTAAIDQPENREEDYRRGTIDELAVFRLRQTLLDMEIEPAIVDFLLPAANGAADMAELLQELRARTASVFKPVTLRSKPTRIMAFVGPPGVGKTTTLAKLGAIYSLFSSFKIGFITIDTYRIGAAEQMRIYGEIIGASVDVVGSPAELALAVKNNVDKDIILIDTAGRPSKNIRQLAELRDYLDVIHNLDIYLVISATTNKRDMMRILTDYKMIPYAHLIFTKMDETEVPGSLINAAYLSGLPIAYITNGQDVPDDIEVANPEMLAGLVMKDVAV